MSGASERVSGRASGPLLTSRFQDVRNHSAGRGGGGAGGGGDGEGGARRRKERELLAMRHEVLVTLWD